MASGRFELLPKSSDIAIRSCGAEVLQLLGYPSYLGNTRLFRS